MADSSQLDKPDPTRKDIGFDRWRCNERPADLVHMRGNQDNELFWDEQSLRAAWIEGRLSADTPSSLANNEPDPWKRAEEAEKAAIRWWRAASPHATPEALKEALASSAKPPAAEFGPCSCQETGRCRYVNGGPACMNEESPSVGTRDEIIEECARAVEDYLPLSDGSISYVGARRASVIRALKNRPERPSSMALPPLGAPTDATPAATAMPILTDEPSDLVKRIRAYSYVDAEAVEQLERELAAPRLTRDEIIAKREARRAEASLAPSAGACNQIGESRSDPAGESQSGPAKRLYEIEHAVYHFLESGEERVSDNELTFDLPNEDYDKLVALIGDSHPEPWSADTSSAKGNKE